MIALLPFLLASSSILMAFILNTFSSWVTTDLLTKVKKQKLICIITSTVITRRA